MSTTLLRHGKIDLALHELRTGPGHPLLLLHGLGERSPASEPAEFASWPGAVYAMDFTGHGKSTVPVGGGYTAEILMADVDVALERLGSATLVGRGLGAYVALLCAGARPVLVRGVILRDGPGLSGGGAIAPSPYITPVLHPLAQAPDPLALADLSHDVRPPDYIMTFVQAAVQESPLSRPISVCALERPEWLRAAVSESGVEQTSLAEALAYYAARV